MITTTTKIDRFVGSYHFLSNFFLTPVTHEGLTYPSAEHLYQALKTNLSAFRKLFTDVTMSPRVAKHAGAQLPRMIVGEAAWDHFRLSNMALALSLKFAPGSKMLAALLLTCDAELEEGNSWHDTFFGVCDGRCWRLPHPTEPAGMNHLGKLLMARRDLALPTAQN